MTKTRWVLGAILGVIIYLAIVCLSLIVTTFYVLPGDITSILPWFFLGLVPLIIVFGQYILERDKKLKRGIKLGFCGYILWSVMLILLKKLVNFEIGEYYSILIGYAVILAIVVLGQRYERKERWWDETG